MALPQGHENTLERRLTYQDNNVNFFWYRKEKHTINALSFTVKSLKITSSQDPNGVNNPNDQHPSYSSLNKGRKLEFRVGRKASKEVATFWTNTIVPYRNTFYKNPNDLNFAFIGTLNFEVAELSLKWEGKNIAIAQGNTGTVNNWWFGGTDCSFNEEWINAVSCTGTNKVNGKRTVVVFYRGGSSGNDGVELQEFTEY